MKPLGNYITKVNKGDFLGSPTNNSFNNKKNNKKSI